MNYCRTCKYWSVNANKIGFGLCLNAEVSFLVDTQGLYTAQNFGCVKYEGGQCTASLYSPEEEIKVLSEFLKARHDIVIEQ